MISRIHVKWRGLRRFFNQSEWMSRLLGLPKTPGDSIPGLVLIQLDGLSHPELQRALKRGEMPFLSRLLQSEQYEIRPMFSGLPSTTAAVQGELMYGIPAAVPAFGFFDRTSGRIRKMLESDSAKNIEEGLAKQGEALLKGGSSYVNVYTGGAKEPRWCAASMGWGTSTKSPGPIVLALLIVLNGYSFIRALAFGLLEFLIGIWDAIKGIWNGERPPQELKFILTRLATCVFLREWVVQAASMDVARGLPIIHLNLLGYDEQSHRRGPDSSFAHWVLKGMDDAVKRIWSATRISDRRDYEVWIYSDHGQIHSHPYTKIMGKSLKMTVEELWGLKNNGVKSGHGVSGHESQRIRYLGGKRLQKLFPDSDGKNGIQTDLVYPIVTDTGPLAMVYLEPGTDAERRKELGMRLARDKGVPLVIDTKAGPMLHGWSSDGPFTLPRDAEGILGKHPFLEQLLPDLERLCRHELVGDLILFGWKNGLLRPLTFTVENGAHGGISPEECAAFLAMPEGMSRNLMPPIPRPMDIYRSALIYQGRVSAEAARPLNRSSGLSQIRVMTYNVHSCIGMDRRHDLNRIARVIAHYRPDIVALQELDTGHDRSQGLHQAQEIGRLLQLECHFHAVREIEDEQFGNAILSRFPMKLVRAGGFPASGGRRRLESRGALWVEVDVEGTPVQIVNTHLGLRPHEKLLQAKALMGERWLGGRMGNVPLILCGDMNCGAKSPAYLEFRKHLSDCQLQLKGHKPRNTWFTRFPIARLDHILVSPPLSAREIHVPTFQLAVMASDHFPLVADIALSGGENYVA